MLTPHRQALVDAGAIALRLAGSAEVAAAWDDESSCAGMTVGGLTHHLVRQAVVAAELLDAVRALSRSQRAPEHVSAF
jgi:hypothetical protein